MRNFSLKYPVLVLLLSAAFPAVAEDNVELEAVEVSAKRQSSMTEQQQSYTAGQMNTATGMALSVKDTPQSVSALTRRQLDDQSVNSLENALQTVTGVNAVRDASRLRFQSRGFFVDQIGEDGIMQNVAGRQGLSDNVDSGGSTDLAVYDHIEVLRGAAGLTVAESEPGGTVNLIRKRPTAAFQHIGEISADKWGTKRLMADVSGKLNSDGILRGRLVGVHEHKESFKDRVAGRKNMLYGILEADIGERSMLTFGGMYQKDHDKPDFTGVFLPCENQPDSYAKKCGNTPEEMPRHTYLAQDWTHSESRRFNVFLKGRHAFENGWKLGAEGNYVQTDADNRIGAFVNEVESWPGAASQGNYSLHAINPFRYQKKDKQFGFKLDLNGKYSLFNKEHEFYAAYTFNKSDVSSSFIQHWDFYPTYFSGGVGSTNGYWRHYKRQYPIYGMTGAEIAEPDWSLYGIEPRFIYHAQSDQNWLLRYNYNNYINQNRNHGITLSTRLNVGKKWHFLLGTRYTRYNNYSSKIQEMFDGERKQPRSDYEYISQLKGHKFIPYFGITYDLTPNHSLYASYTGVFKPQENTDTSYRNLLPPVTGSNYEIGWKSSLLGGRLNTSLALFKIVQKNRGIASVDDNFMTSMNPVGRVVSKGVDLEIAGELNPNWQIFAGYTYNKSKYSRAEKPQVCSEELNWDTFEYEWTCRQGRAWDEDLNFSRHTPEHIFRLYTTYRIPHSKWTIGGGVSAQSKTASLYNVKQSGYALWNAHIRYDFHKNAHIVLSGTNLGDKTYFENNEHRTRARNNFYGQPRTLSFKLGWKF